MTRRLQGELQQSRPFPTVEEEVCVEIQRTAQVTVRWIVEALKPSGLTLAQFNVLRILRGARPDGLSSSAVAERMVNHDPDLTRLLDRLEAAGLVEKSRDTQDRRVMTARITKEGVRLVEVASDAVRHKVVTALKSVDHRKLGSLADLLELVRGSPE